MSWLQAGIMIGGTLLNQMNADSQADAASERGSRQAAEIRRAAAANKRISEYDAEVALEAAARIRKQTERDVSLHFQEMDRIIATQKASFANRGVSVSDGSPVNIQMETMERGVKDARVILYNGKTAESQARSAAGRYFMLADAGLRDSINQALMIEDAANQEASNIRWGGYADTAMSIYNIGDKQGWFD